MPIVAIVLNLPPYIRTKFAAMLLFGVMPPKVKDYDNLLRVMYQQCQTFMWESNPRGPGLSVFNGHTRQHEQKWLCWKRITEDSKGLPKPVGCSTQPAYIGACPWCNIKGVRGVNCTYYPWAIPHTARDHPARALLRQMFGVAPGAADGDDHTLPLVVVPAKPAKPKPAQHKRVTKAKSSSKTQRVQLDMKAEDSKEAEDSKKVRARDAPLLRKHLLGLLVLKPKKRTSNEAYESGLRSQENPKTKSAEPFVKVSPYQKMFGPGFPLLERINNCSAHAFGNSVGNMAALITNTKPMVFDSKHRKLEKAAGRNFPKKYALSL
jgi:hypothetical protein